MDFLSKKLNKRIEDILESREFDDSFFTVSISKETEKLLHNYQILHVYNLITKFKDGNNVLVDGSQTGTGKTYTSIALCKELNLKPFIVCPLSVINKWIEVCDYFCIKYLDVVNYESVKNSKYYSKTDGWNLPPSCIVIFDEAHRCKNIGTNNNKLLTSLKPFNKTKILLLSATLCDRPEHFHTFGYMLGFYDDIKKGKSWIASVVKEFKHLNKHIFPEKGSQMSILELGDEFPKNIINADAYTVDIELAALIKKYYKYLEKSESIELVKLNKARQKIELCKVPLFVELIEKYLSNDFSVVVFVNFIDTIEKLEEELMEREISFCVIKGDISIKERESNIKLFQKNKIKVMLCTSQVGGQSISLHDTDGKYPRATLISPNYSSIDLLQTLGRVYRAGCKSPVIQNIIFVKGTQEEHLSKKIKEKITFLAKMNNIDDLNLLKDLMD